MAAKKTAKASKKCGAETEMQSPDAKGSVKYVCDLPAGHYGPSHAQGDTGWFDDSLPEPEAPEDDALLAPRTDPADEAM